MKTVATFPALLSALMLAALAACSTPMSDSGSSAALDDATLTKNVKTAMYNQTDLNASGITVDSYEGAVQLSGFVSSQAEIDKALAAARSINGVKSVTNDLRLK
jgi:osmotically-inducible protein OsmY